MTACSDGIEHIWTTDHENTADTVELDSFASQISQYKLSRMIVGGLKLEDLPGLDALKTPGINGGQTKVVREGDNGVAYAWNMREQKQDKIGEVFDGPDNSMKPSVLNSVQNHVIDVDIGDGDRTRRLSYDRSGISDGQTKVVREGDNGVAYAWNMREQKWDKIGEVFDGADDNMKPSVLNGVQNHGGEPTRRLPYNRSGMLVCKT